MTALRVAGVLVLMAIATQVGRAQYSPEEQALVAIATAKDVRGIEQHLPEIVREHIANLAPSERAELERAIWAPFASREFTVHVPEDGHALLVFEGRGRTGETETIDVVVARKISNGVEAMLELQPRFGNATSAESDSLRVWLRLEDGEWRVAELQGPWGKAVRFDEHFVEHVRHTSVTAQESAAIGSVRTLNTAQVTYSATYPEVGFANGTEVLAGQPGEEPTPQHAMLIDEVLGTGTKSGYRFTMAADGGIPREHYQIIARPLKYGETGRRSFFSDESGVIRFTEEDRDATPDDQPLR